MEFIPGNYYRARNGQKVYCVGELKHTKYSLLVCEYLGDSKHNWDYKTVASDGTYSIVGNSEWDIISEWEDKAKLIEPFEAEVIEFKPSNHIYLFQQLYRKLTELIDVVNDLGTKVK
jgi:hypothetical protein